jgi:CHAD domain-containing protein/HD superfamily phosphodiesterase
LSPAASPDRNRARKVTGLRYWMTRVLAESEKVSADFSADPVHDLRVALRRCRSMADGLIAMDPDPEWKAMKKAGKRLFQRLGDLRDVQIMMEWLEKLEPDPSPVAASDSPALPQPEQSSGNMETAAEVPNQIHPARDLAAHALLEILAAREVEQKREARSALEEFDRQQWREWGQSLPARAARVRLGSALFQHLALERWTAARELHVRAMRNRSQIALHTLRIGIKRFRYIVENFLPEQHKLWKDDLKEMQDMLGEVHDLDVLWATALSCHVFPDEESRKRWHARILEQRSKRVERYRAKMTGPQALWNVWRAALPQGKQIQVLATRRMKLWAKALDPDFPHSERVARLALELYDGLTSAGLLPSTNGTDARSSLFLAALLHDVGKSKKKKGHHKASVDLIKSHGTPLGWPAEAMQRAAVVARFHCGALPTRSHKALRDLLPPEQKTTIQLAAILRLANAMDAEHNGHIHSLRVDKTANGSGRVPSGCVVVTAEGYSERSATARVVAAERHLLETILHRPVLIKPMKLLMAPRTQTQTSGLPV